MKETYVIYSPVRGGFWYSRGNHYVGWRFGDKFSSRQEAEKELNAASIVAPCWIQPVTYNG